MGLSDLIGRRVKDCIRNTSDGSVTLVLTGKGRPLTVCFSSTTDYDSPGPVAVEELCVVKKVVEDFTRKEIR